MQGRPTPFVNPIYIDSGMKKSVNYIHVSPVRCAMKRRTPILLGKQLIENGG